MRVVGCMSFTRCKVPQKDLEKAEIISPREGGAGAISELYTPRHMRNGAARREGSRGGLPGKGHPHPPGPKGRQRGTGATPRHMRHGAAMAAEGLDGLVPSSPTAGPKGRHQRHTSPPALERRAARAARRKRGNSTGVGADGIGGTTRPVVSYANQDIDEQRLCGTCSTEQRGKHIGNIRETGIYHIHIVTHRYPGGRVDV